MERSVCLGKVSGTPIKCFVCVPKSPNSFEVFGLQGALKASTLLPGTALACTGWLAGLLGTLLVREFLAWNVHFQLNRNPEEWRCDRSSIEHFLQVETSSAFQPLATCHLLVAGSSHT